MPCDSMIGSTNGSTPSPEADVLGELDIDPNDLEIACASRNAVISAPSQLRLV